MRQIKFNGKYSGEDYRALIAPYPETKIGSPAPICIREEIPYMDGSYDFSAMDGKIHYKDRTLTYTFCLHGENREDLETQRSNIISWLLSAAGTDLHDDDFPEWHFTNVTANTFGELDYVSRNGRNAKFSVTFTACPYLISDNGYDPTIEPPKSLTSSVLFSGAEYSDDGKTAVMTYQISGGGMVRRSTLSGITISAASPVKTAGTTGGYFYAVAEQNEIIITYKSETVNIKAMAEGMSSAFKIDVYPARYGRSRRL